MKKFLCPIRIYYEDTDSGGVVYHANYLKFLERARTEWFRQKGYELDQMAKQFGILFVVKSLTINFCKPATFNEQLAVLVELTGTNKASLDFKQVVTGLNNENELICSASVKIACLSVDTFKPKAIPKSVLEEIASV